MAAEAGKRELKPLAKEAVGIHLTRSFPEKLKEFVGVQPTQNNGMLERLAAASGGIYALNSGIVAMKEVARGALGGFVNIITNPWDVAAREVLVRACGGTVTNFAGRPIEYIAPGTTSVIAAQGHLHGAILQALDQGGGEALAAGA
jgi:fructose-1,6-bisphosphatase/inositol monophosphatase family enzyme